MGNLFYTVIIYPIVQIIEVIYVLIYKIFDNPSIAVIGVSFAVTFLCLPLYIVAENWQHREREIIKKLKPKIDKIKSVFKGDEQYMILSTYYRQNHYHPVYALRNSFGILIQIPFFIAAYSYLSRLEVLNGSSFLFIRDMSVPDASLSIGNLKINILPIMMILINGISGAVYTSGLSGKDKAQVYGTAALFLVLLYNSPAGLVLYWTMNNVFSLFKNILYKLKNPLKILYIIISFCVLVFIVYILFFNSRAFLIRLALIGAASLILLTPLFVKCIKIAQRSFLDSLLHNRKQQRVLFILSCIILTVFIGLCIPSVVIASSPGEFSFIDAYRSPFPFIYYSLLQSLGLCLFWPLCIYFLFNDKIKTILTTLFAIIAIYALVNDLVFQNNYGTILNTFHFNTTGVLVVSVTTTVLNIVSLLGIVLLFFYLVKKEKIKVIISCVGIILLSLTIYSGYNIVRIHSGYNKVLALQNTSQAAVNTITPVFSLSRGKPNVIVVMADCAINGYIKPIFEEHPFLKESFDGFTVYPNTVSFALHTLMGAPPIWGGYDYTPREMNARDSVPLIEKNNEALLVLPRLLAGAGYQVTVTDPSWANYEWIPDTSIYKNYENITAFNTIGRYSNLWYTQNNYGNSQITSTTIKRNILWFSILKIAPPALRILIYDDGWYWSTDDIGESNIGFINSYSVLDFLPELTTYNAEASSALLITNDTTHNLTFLQYPDYTPVETVTSKGDSEFSDSDYYHVNSAFYLKFAEWLDDLKKNGVYDNTRIIIVSDHGAGVNAHLADTPIPIPDEQREKYNPVLLVKDFDEHGELKTDMAFMTNADVPFLTVKDIIDNPVNPFNGKPITTEPKYNGVYITINHMPQVYQHSKYTFNIRSNQWVFVRDNIFDEKNWSKVGP
ncbi:MAG: YidC/Oxa1 family membrane protein insertase [Treponema sp.]|jgi:YidC/Oxa1 family membrane protein insertase|nr:YidC/Oxa1 family membrane protein insertase [Treponema sp.]